MNTTPSVRRALRGTLAAGAGAIIALTTAPPVTAQEPAGQDAMGAVADAVQALPEVPGQPALPEMPGLGQTGGGDPIQQAAGAIQQHWPDDVRKQHTQAPANGQEASTQPQCAPNVFVAVPGTFEINRDQDPNEPVGLLGDFLKPIQDTLGGALSVTYINYDSDAGVNGTSYRRSVDAGVKKTLATVTDVAERCKDSQIFLGGFSQGAEIAGDTAMQVGQRQTSVDPGRIGGVVLFSDPRRDQGANFLVGTGAQQPAMPDILSGIVDSAMKDPTLAQMQVDAKPLADLANNANDSFQQMMQGSGPADSGQTNTSGGGLGGGDNGGFEVPDAGNAGGDTPAGGDSGFEVPDAGNTGGGIPAGGDGGFEVPDAGNTGGGLGAAQPAAYSGGGAVMEKVYPAVGPQMPDPTLSIQTAEFNKDVGDAQALFVQNETEPAPSDDDVVERYITGGCGNQTIEQCKTSENGDGGAATTDNPYEDDLRAAVEAAEGDSKLAKLESVCDGRMSAEVCGGSQKPKGAVDYTEPKPEGATGIALMPKEIGDACPADVSPHCFGGSTRVEGTDPAKIPDEFGGTGYWVTPELENRTGEMHSYYAALENQAMTRNDVDSAGDAGGAAEIRVPAGVTTIVNPADGTSRPLAVEDKDGRTVLAATADGEGDDAPVAADSIGELFDTGWVMGRSEADGKVFNTLIDRLFQVGGCGEMTLDECTKSFDPGSGKSDAGLSTGQINARIYRGLSEKPEANSVPENFRETCLTLTLAECEKNVSSDVPGLPPVSEEQPAEDGAAQSGGEEAAPTTSQLEDSSETSSSVPDTSSSQTEPLAADGGERSGGAAGADADSTTTSGGAAGGDGPTSAQAAGGSGTQTSASKTSSGSSAATTSASGQAAGGEGTSASGAAGAAGADDGETSAQAAGESESTPQTTGSEAPEPSGAAGESGEGADDASQQRVDIDKVTMEAVAGGGLSGSRDADFGALTGRVVSACVPGDIICSLPEDSQLARSLVELGKNFSANIPEMASGEGPTRMGGLLAVQAVDTVLEITGLPRLKLSPETIEALIKVVAGAGLIASGNQPAGSALLMSVLPQLPTILPEVAAQLADLPKILESLPDVPEKAAENLGLVNGELQKGFEAGGLSNPADLTRLPEVLPNLLNALVNDNSGLFEMATNPAYYNSGQNHSAFDKLQVSENQNAFQWTETWFNTLGKQKQ